MIPAQRDYAGDTDRAAVIALWLAARSAGAGDPWPSLDTIDAELAACPAGSGEVQLWEERGGRLVGAALLLDASILVRCARAGADDEALAGAMVSWGLERAARAARSSGEGPALFVPVCAGDERLAALLRGLRFLENGWRTLRMERALGAPIDAPRPPAGVTIRPAADEGDRAAAAALHAALFEGGQKAAGERTTLMGAPGYRPALDLVAALADGTVAGYAIGTCCALERGRLARATGWLEFIGVAHGQRGRGLGRALALAMLRAMRAEGLDAALLTTSAGNRAARGLFEACGFRTRHEVRWFVCELETA